MSLHSFTWMLLGVGCFPAKIPLFLTRYSIITKGILGNTAKKNLAVSWLNPLLSSRPPAYDQNEFLMFRSIAFTKLWPLTDVSLIWLPCDHLDCRDNTYDHFMMDECQNRWNCMIWPVLDQKMRTICCKKVLLFYYLWNMKHMAILLTISATSEQN